MRFRSGRVRRLVVVAAAGAMGATLLPVTAASAAVDTSSFCASVSDENPFTDVESSDVHYDNILCLASLEITVGQTATTYGPGEATSRAQMASFIARFIDRANQLEIDDLEELPTADSGPNAFPDDDGSVHEDNINRLAAAGIVEGKTDGTYDPDEAVNRSQMASYIARAIEFLTGSPLASGGDAFGDDDGSTHEANINTLAGIEVVEGKTDGGYHPGENVLRSQMASYLIRSAAYLHSQGAINPAPGEGEVTQGPITLSSSRFPEGGTVTGRIADPTTVENLSVQGCGLGVTDLSVNGATGAFSFTLPPDENGTCTLHFAVAYTDGSSVNVEFVVTVGERADDITDAPDLISAAYATSTNQIIFTFDEEITSINAVPGFHAYGAFALGASAIDADIRIEDRNTVIATFDNNLLQLVGGFITRVGIDRNTVNDAEGNINYPDFAPVNDQPAGITIGPDLISVDNLRTDSQQRIVADFTFDDPVLPGVTPARFLLAEQSTNPLQTGQAAPGVYVGMAETDRSDDNRTITMQFGTTAGPATPNTSQAARGIVLDSAVLRDAAPLGNPPNIFQVEDACVGGGPVGTCTPATNGTVNGKTDAPDIVKVEQGGNTSLRITFDEPIDAVAIAPGNFAISNFVIFPVAGVSALRSATDTRVVDVDFATPIDTAAVMLQVFPGAVVGTTGEQLPNIYDEAGFGGAPAGATAGPDLLRVTADQLPNGGWVVAYEFDAPLVAGPATPGEFFLVDEEGTQTTNTGGVVVGNKVIITTDVTTETAAGLGAFAGASVGFDASDILDSVLGSVDDVLVGPNPFPGFTEGEAPLTITALP